MRVLAIITGEYGQRHVENTRAHAPGGWEVFVWQAPSSYPLVGESIPAAGVHRARITSHR